MDEINNNEALKELTSLEERLKSSSSGKAILLQIIQSANVGVKKSAATLTVLGKLKIQLQANDGNINADIKNNVTTTIDTAKAEISNIDTAVDALNKNYQNKNDQKIKIIQQVQELMPGAKSKIELPTSVEVFDIREFGEGVPF